MGASENLSKTGRIYTLMRRRRDMKETEISSHLTGESQFTSMDAPKNLENAPV